MKRIVITLMAIVLAVGMVGCGSLVKEKDGRTIVGDISFSTPSWENAEDKKEGDDIIVYRTSAGFYVSIKMNNDKSADDQIGTLTRLAESKNGALYESEHEVDGQTVKGAEAIYDIDEDTLGNVFVALIEHKGTLYIIQMIYMERFDPDGDSLNDYKEFKKFVESIELN